MSSDKIIEPNIKQIDAENASQCENRTLSVERFSYPLQATRSYTNTAVGRRLMNHRNGKFYHSFGEECAY